MDADEMQKQESHRQGAKHAKKAKALTAEDAEDAEEQPGEEVTNNSDERW